MRKAPTFRSSPEPFPHAPHGCRQQNLRCPDFCPYYGKSNAMRGGQRPGAGRPKRSTQPRRDRMTTALASGRPSSLDYMLAVMNDPDADPARRDRMAIAAAPYVHGRAADARSGKKQEAEQAALTVERGTKWDSLLVSPAAGQG